MKGKTEDSEKSPPILTYLVNIGGGASSGKSTLAAAVYAELKSQNKSVELVREYVKTWCYRDHKINELWDPLYIFAKHLRAQSALYGKVEYIITDSPLWLSPVYEEFYTPNETTMSALYWDIRIRQDNNNIRNIDCIVTRDYPYVVEARFETEDEAKRVDKICRDQIRQYYTVSTVGDVLRAIQTEKDMVFG